MNEVKWKVLAVPECNTIYTYGLEELFGHHNFMITSKYMDSEWIKEYHVMLNIIAKRVADGGTFKDGDLVEEIIATDYRVKLRELPYGKGNHVYFLILFPDANHEFDNCERQSLEIFERESDKLKNSTKPSTQESIDFVDALDKEIKSSMN